MEERNDSFDGFSNLLEMKQTAERGRFMVAKKRISVGTVLGAENPMASMILYDKMSTNCYTCYQSIRDYFIPCPGCNEVKNINLKDVILCLCSELSLSRIRVI